MKYGHDVMGFIIRVSEYSQAWAFHDEYLLAVSLITDSIAYHGEYKSCVNN